MSAEHVRRRWPVLAAFAVVAALSLLSARRLHIAENIRALLPDTDPAMNENLLVLQRFRAMDILFIDVGVRTDSPRDTARAEAVADALHARLVASKMFQEIHYRVSPESMAKVYERLTAAKAGLLTSSDLHGLADRLTPDAIRKRLEADKRALIEPQGPFVRERVREDPLGFDGLVLAKLRQLSGMSTRGEVIDGRLWSRDRRHIPIIAIPSFPAMDTHRGRRLPAMLAEAGARVAAPPASRGRRAAALPAAPPGAVRISCIGGHLTSLGNATTIKADVQRSMTLTTVLIAVIALLFSRRLRAIVLVFLPAAFGVAVALGTFGLLDPAVSSIAIGFGAALVGIAVDYGIHILYRAENGEDSPHECARALSLPLTMGAVTTIGALLCMGLSSVPAQRQVGQFAALGMLGSVVFSLVALPHLISSRAREGRRRLIPLAQYSRRFLAWQTRRRGTSAAVLLVLVAVGIVGTSRTRFEGDMEKLNYLSPALRADEARIKRVWGDLTATYVVVGGSTLQEALAANDRVWRELRALETAGMLGEITSITPILPSEQTQRENRRAWAQFWSEARQAQLRKDLAAAMSAVGFAPHAFDPFLASLGARPTPLTRTDFAGTSIGSLIDRQIARDGGGFYVLSAFTTAAPHAQIARRLRAAVPNALVVNKRRMVTQMAGLVRREFGLLALAACVVVTIILRLFLGRIELVAVALLPILASVLITLGALGFFAVPINLISCLFIVFVFGVGIDYSIFLLNGALETSRGGTDHGGATCGSVVLCALTTMCGFAGLILARHPALSSVGITGVTGLGASMVASILGVPALSRCLLPHEGRHGTPSLKTLLGALWAYAFLAAAGLWYYGLMRGALYLRHRNDPLARQRRVRAFIHATARALLRFFPYRGSERIFIDAGPEAFARPSVIVSNHLSAFDIMVILALPVDMIMVVKAWVRRVPLLGVLIEDACYVVTAEGMTADRFFAECSSCLARGVSVMVFPEGTRSADGRMHRFHKGAFELAIRTRSDVIPVLLTNTQACMPLGSWWIGDHRSVVRVLPAVTPRGFDFALGARELGRHVKTKLLAFEQTDWRLAQSGRAFRRNVRGLYNYAGRRAEREVARRLRRDPLCETIDRVVPERGTIVEIDCGIGLLSNILALKSRERRVVGVEADERAIATARLAGRTLANVSFETHEIPEADAIIWGDRLPGRPPDSGVEHLRGACRRLRPGGLLILSRGDVRRGIAEACGLTAHDSVTPTLSVFRKGDDA